MKFKFYALALMLFACFSLDAQEVLFDNGPLVTSPGTGVDGADESILQTTSLNMSTLGFGFQIVNENSVADDFVVPSGETWTLSSFTFFGYQSFYTSPISPFTEAYVRIWDGQPGQQGSNIIFGDLSTNRLMESFPTGIQRVTETTAGFASDRPIYEIITELDLVLTEGTYWIEYQAAGVGNSGPWAPPITIVGQTTTGNGLQSVDNGITFMPALDGGTSTQQGFPFLLEGVKGGLPSPWAQQEGNINCTTSEADYDQDAETFELTASSCFGAPSYTSDTYAFIQQELCGNGEIIVKLDDLSGSVGFAGITMRENNDVGSKKVDLLLNGSNLGRRAVRNMTNGPAFPKQFFAFNKSWLRLVRTGNQFAGYISPNGINWQPVLYTNVMMGSCIEVGMIANTSNINATTVATFSNVQVIGGSMAPSSLSVSVNTNQVDSDVAVFPNPNAGNFTVKLPIAEEGNNFVQVFDQMGRIIYEQEAFDTRHEINLSDAPAGIYILKAMQANGQVTTKKVNIR